MTLLLREVGRFVFESLLWVGVLAAITGAVVAPLVAFRNADRPARLMGVSLVGAAGIASLAHRLGLPMAWAPTIGSRDLPIVWAAAGAISVALMMVARHHRSVAGP